MKLVGQEAQVALGFLPVNLATAANAGDWVSMKQYKNCCAIFVAGAGAAGEIPTITMEQASAVAGTGAKALPIRAVFVKDGADLLAIGTFTKVAPTTANTYALAAGDTQKIVLVEVDAEDLDSDGGFDCVRASVNDVGTTSQLGALLYLLTGPRYTPPASAIVD